MRLAGEVRLGRQVRTNRAVITAGLVVSCAAAFFVASSVSAAAHGSAPAWCGKKPIVVGYNSGNDANGWRKMTKAIFRSYVKTCPNVTKVIYTDAGGSAQTQISQFQSLIAQGANVIVTIPDAGKALLPAMAEATQRGIAVVPFTEAEGAKPGVTDATAVVGDDYTLGEDWGRWMCTRLHGHGNVVFMGGVPGNAQSLTELSGTRKAFHKSGCTGMKILSPAPVTTNWQVQMYQQAMAGLLAKYQKIGGVIVDFGGGFNGAITAFQNAHRKIPPIATNSDNQLTCSLMKAKAPFIMYTSGNEQVDNAFRQGVSKYEGIKDPQKGLYEQKIVFNTTGGPKPQCAPGLPAGAALGEGLTVAQLKKVLG